MQENIKLLLTSFLEKINKEDNENSINSNLYKFLIQQIRKNVNSETYLREVDDFHYNYIYPYQDILSEFISTIQQTKNKDYINLKINSKFYEKNLFQLMCKLYGGSCSVDKARTLVDRFEYTLLGKENIKWDKDQFYIPDTVSENTWNEYMFAIQDLYDGKIDSYLVVYSKLLNEHNLEVNSVEYKKDFFFKKVNWIYLSINKYPEPEVFFDPEKSKLLVDELKFNLPIIQNILVKLKDSMINIEDINQLCQTLKYDLKDLIPKRNLKTGWSERIEEHMNGLTEKGRVYHAEFDSFFDGFKKIQFIKNGINISKKM